MKDLIWVRGYQRYVSDEVSGTVPAGPVVDYIQLLEGDCGHVAQLEGEFGVVGQG